MYTLYTRELNKKILYSLKSLQSSRVELNSQERTLLPHLKDLINVDIVWSGNHLKWSWYWANVKMLKERRTDGRIDWWTFWLMYWRTDGLMGILRLMYWRIDGHTDWCTDGLIDWWAYWLLYWRTDGLMDILTDILTDWWTEGLMDWWTYWLMYWRIDGHTDWCTDGLMDWWTYWLMYLTDWWTYWLMYWRTDGYMDILTDVLMYWQTDAAKNVGTKQETILL